MVRVAKSDHSYRVEEIQRIDRTLARANDIGPIEAAKMRATCERLEAEAPADTAEFAALIRETVSRDGRFSTLRALWQVLMADGLEHPEELDVITATCEALGLTPEDNAAARIAATDG